MADPPTPPPSSKGTTGPKAAPPETMPPPPPPTTSVLPLTNLQIPPPAPPQQAAIPSSQPSLTSLPPELLHPILHHAFHLHHPAIYSILLWLSATSSLKQLSHTDALSPANFPGFMLACKSLYHSGWEVLLEGGVLGLSVFSDCDEPELKEVGEWFEGRGVAWLLRRVRIVRVVGGWPSTGWGGAGGVMGGLRRVVVRMGVVVEFVVREEQGEESEVDRRLRDVLEGRWPARGREGSGGERHEVFERWAKRVACAGKGTEGWAFTIEQGMQAVVRYKGRELLMDCTIDLRNFEVLSRRYFVRSSGAEASNSRLVHMSTSELDELATADDAMRYFTAKRADDTRALIGSGSLTESTLNISHNLLPSVG